MGNVIKWYYGLSRTMIIHSTLMHNTSLEAAQADSCEDDTLVSLSRSIKDSIAFILIIGCYANLHIVFNVYIGFL